MVETPKPGWARRLTEFVFRMFTGHTRKLAEEMVDEGDDVAASNSPSAFDSDTNGNSVDEETKEEQRERGIAALTATLSRRWWTYFAILAIPIVIAVISWICFDRTNLTPYAHFYEIFGAITIARGVLRDPREIDRMSKTILPTGGPRDGSERLLAAFETVDALLGILFLILGFTLQLLDATGPTTTIVVLVSVVLGWWMTTGETPTLNK